MNNVVLALVPHPDDLEWYAGGTVARMVGEGARAVIVIATDGSKGSYEYDGATLARLRCEEARRAAEVLRAEPPIMLGHPDLELDRLPAGVLREEFIRLIRRWRPYALIAQDPYGGAETHPDHRTVAWAATEAVTYARLPLVHPEHLADGLETHLTVERYWYANDMAQANKVVDVSATMAVRLAALAENRSQIAQIAEGLRREARAAGLDPEQVMNAYGDPLALVKRMIEEQAANAGRRIGVKYGEAFRYERFDPLVEGLL
jgi:LmbE family N-acetylglucosaminyl deacetylase